MTGKIILNLAISLDGYIADTDGGFDWIVGQGDTSIDTENRWDYTKFLEDIDIVVMGKIVMTRVFTRILKIKTFI